MAPSVGFLFLLQGEIQSPDNPFSGLAEVFVVLWLVAFACGSILFLVLILSPLVIAARLGRLNKTANQILNELRRINPQTK